MEPIIINTQTHNGLVWKSLVLVICLFLLPNSSFGQFVQDCFVIGAYRVSDLVNNEVNNVQNFQQISNANFNLIMYPGYFDENFYSNNMDYVLDIAAQTGLRVLAYDENSYTIDGGVDGDVSPFDQQEANAERISFKA